MRAVSSRSLGFWLAVIAASVAASPGSAADEAPGSPWRWSGVYKGESHRNLRGGLCDLNSEFDVSMVAALFLDGVQGIDIEFSEAGLKVPLIFLLTALAARREWAPADGWRLRGAVLDGVPGDPERPKVTPWTLDSVEGALRVAEIDRSVATYRFVLGRWRFTSIFDDLAQGDVAGDPLRCRGAHGTYAFVEGSLWQSKDGPRACSR